MNGKTATGADFWVEEFNGQVYTPTTSKRKVRSKKREYIGWGSTLLISFLESIGKDTSKPLTQYDVTAIINEYVLRNNLIHPQKKRRIVCDQRLHSLFGRKSIGRVKIHEMLESHFAVNNEESSEDSLLNSEDDENTLATCEPQKTTSESKPQSKKRVSKKPKSCFAAIIPANIKLVYLRKSLVQDLLKYPKTFESKLVGSFIRIKCDPNDYLQKNSHQLLQVTGIKKCPGMKDMNEEIVLQVSGFFKDVGIHMLSDDDFSEDECDDLCQRVKGGLLKRPMIVDLEQKARVLHEDMTKHWLARELTVLQNLIDRANEKGWRRELDEYLTRKEKLQTPDEQARLLREIPSVISDEVESESTEPDVPDEDVKNDVPDEDAKNGSPKLLLTKDKCENVENDSPKLLQTKDKQVSLLTDVQREVRDVFEPETTPTDIADCVRHESNSPKSILIGASEVLRDMSTRGTAYSHGTGSAENCNGIPVQQQPMQQIDLTCEKGGRAGFEEAKPVQQIDLTCENVGGAGVDEAKVSKGAPNKQILPPEVIELSDDEEETEEPSSAKQTTPRMFDSSIRWHYKDPQGRVQGPFSIDSLKRWNDANYFPPDFKVWREGQRPDECVLLVDVLHWLFAN